MANILDQQTLGSSKFVVVDSNPSSGGGTVAPLATLALFNNGGTGEAWLKTGSANTAWNKLSTI
jgi:hypothetical protein